MLGEKRERLRWLMRPACERTGVGSLEHGSFAAPGQLDAYDETLADRLVEARIS